jgi:hypothetical protein
MTNNVTVEITTANTLTLTAQGPKGDPGVAGQGIAIGGATGEFLVKASGDDYDTGWSASSATVNELGDVTNVTITTVAAGEVIKWSGTAWINNTLAEAGISAVGHTHTASEVTDFDTEVGNNSAVTSNTAKITYDSTSSTKVAFISVTQAVDLDTMESNISTNNSKTSNATHTGEVTGATALTVDPTAISGKTLVTAVGADHVMIYDATDGSLKKSLISDFASAGGDMAAATYDPTTVAGDTFDMDNMVEGTTTKILTGTERTKLSGIETAANVTDTANVTSAGALMDSELTSIADVKALDQSVVSGASPVFDATNMTNIPAGTVDVLSNVATARLVGRTTAGSGNSEELTKTASLSFLNVEDGASADQIASEVTNTASGNLASTDVQGSLDELQGDIDTINTSLGGLTDAVVLKGTWDASAGTFPGAGSAQAGWSYIVSVAGTVNSIVFAINDRLLSIVDNASTTVFASNWHKLDYTDEVLSVAGKTGAVTLATGDIISGTFADARIAQSNVTQHEAAIDHDALTNYAAGEHRIINDSGTTTTELFSASKINTELSGKADTSHTHTLSDVTDSGALAALNTVSNSEIDNNAVTNAKMATVATNTIKGRVTAATGNSEDLTSTQARTVLNVEDGSTADQSNAEIETAYNTQVTQISAGEKTAGTEVAVRRFAPDDVKDMIDTHAGDVSAAAVMTNHALVRGDGGVKGIQDSAIIVDDSDNLTKLGNMTMNNGAHTITIEDADMGTGGALTINPGNASDGSAGGALTLQAGDGSGMGSGGDTTVAGGDDSTPGNLTLRGGEGEGGGSATLRGGDSTTSNGADVTITGGNDGSGSSAGGAVKIYGGSSGATEGNTIIAHDGTDIRGKVSIGTATANELVTIEGNVSIKEQAAAGADVASYGQLWVKNDAPNKLYFTDDAGTDTDLSLTGSDETVRTIVFVIDGGGSAITTGIKGDLQVDFGCTINQVTMLADQSGSVVVDIWKDSYANYPAVDGDSITSSAVPTITTATKSQDATLTGWTTAITAGDHLRFNVDSATTIERLTIALKVTTL